MAVAIHPINPQRERHMRASPSYTTLTLGLGPIEPERVELRDLMQKTFLRRNRNHHASVNQQDGLAKLQVPVAQRQPLALEGRHGKIRPLEKVKHGFWLAGVGARCCL